MWNAVQRRPSDVPAGAMRGRGPAVAAIAAAAMVVAAPAHAELLTDPISIIDFDDAASYDLGAARVQIGASLGLDVGVTARAGSLYFGAPYGAWSLGHNGEWTSAKSFVGVEGAADADAGRFPALVFDFGGKGVKSVGAQMNFDPDFVYGGGLPLPLYIAAYDRSGRLLDSHELPVSTPGRIDAGPFYGIALDSRRIASFEVSGPYAVVDNLTFTTPVPEPSSYALLLAGLATLCWLGRRKG